MLLRFFTILYFTEEKINKVKKGGVTIKIRFELRCTWDLWHGRERKKII